MTLTRFIDAQESCYAQVANELRAGKKTSHWMWYIFPQLAGLGSSAMSQRYAIADMDEAKAYLAHPVLGPRLRECCAIVLGHKGLTAHAIFGSPDDLKLRSCMTLFDAVAPDSVFAQVLDQFYDSGRDERTVGILKNC